MQCGWSWNILLSHCLVNCWKKQGLPSVLTSWRNSKNVYSSAFSLGRVWSNLMQWWNISWICPQTVQQLAFYWFDNRFKSWKDKSGMLASMPLYGLYGWQGIFEVADLWDCFCFSSSFCTIQLWLDFCGQSWQPCFASNGFRLSPIDVPLSILLPNSSFADQIKVVPKKPTPIIKYLQIQSWR